MPTKGESTKKMIIDTAAGLFSEKGFKDVSMTDICEATGLSRGGLYRHFSSTSEIFIRLISTEQSFNERIKAKEKAVDILKDALSELEKEILDPKRSLSLAISFWVSDISFDNPAFTDLFSSITFLILSMKQSFFISLFPFFVVVRSIF